MNLTANNIAQITASAQLDVARFAPDLVKAMAYYEINNERRIAAFLAQVAHESMHFRHLEELLGYSAARLVAVWPKRFPTLAAAQPYAYKPEALANHVYANRMGNGPESSGDGWCYRGRGLFELTGADNYRAASRALSRDFMGTNAGLVALPEGAAWTAAWFWKSHGCNELADGWSLKPMTIAINGGLVGYEDGNDVGLDDRVEICTYALTQTESLGA